MFYWTVGSYSLDVCWQKRKPKEEGILPLYRSWCPCWDIQVNSVNMSTQAVTQSRSVDRDCLLQENRRKLDHRSVWTPSWTLKLHRGSREKHCSRSQLLPHQHVSITRKHVSSHTVEMSFGGNYTEACCCHTRRKQIYQLQKVYFMKTGRFSCYNKILSP